MLPLFYRESSICVAWLCLYAHDLLRLVNRNNVVAGSSWGLSWLYWLRLVFWELHSMLPSMHLGKLLAMPQQGYRQRIVIA